MFATVALVSFGCGDEIADEAGYRVPLDPDSPWPKFRRNAVQNGLGSVRPGMTGGHFWEYRTEKGIFSSPVVSGDGTVYVGSADRYFYALNPDGTLRWRFLTGEIIDSAALLDDQGMVYFGSGDGMLYALDRQTGDEVWSFLADDPSERNAYIRWFEGNVAIGPDGTLYVPNDNFYIYAVNRNDGSVVWRYPTPDQTWSLPAVDPGTGMLYVGNNNLMSLMGLDDNTYAVSADGIGVWSADSLGSVVASPMLTGDGKVIVGSFDGFVRAYDRDTGAELWSFASRDHIYASAALLPDGNIVQPSADGTIYALDPDDGSLVWAFDTREPVRSSPAVDADGNVYVGSGEGRLYVLNPDGTLRWAIQLIEEDRNDLNASPALGRDAVYIAGESGQIFSVPYDYCLRPEAVGEERCVEGPNEDLPDDGAYLEFVTQFGAPLAAAPAVIDSNQILAFSLFVRAGGDTELAVMDSDSVQVTVDSTPNAAVVDVSGDRRFLTVTPSDRFLPDGEGNVEVTISGQYLVNLDREGLRVTGGEVGGDFSETFTFEVRPGRSGPFPLAIPSRPGDPAGVWEMYRLAAPMPTILPSYNQIGFDSLHFLIGVTESTADRVVGWVVGARLAEDENRTEVDPTTQALFPLEIGYRGGEVTMVNEAGFRLEVMNATIPFTTFRVTGRVDENGETVESPRVHVTTVCSDIFYGSFLEALGFCNPVTDLLTVFGAAELRPHEGGVQNAPAGVGTVDFAAGNDGITATLSGSSLVLAEHAVGILIVDAVTGRPVTLDYGLETGREVDGNGVVTTVTLPYERTHVPTLIRAYLMVDAYPAARADLQLP